MAINKQITATNALMSRSARASGLRGIDVSYWRIISTQLNYPKSGEATIDVSLGAYVDQASSDAGGQPVTGRRFTYTAKDLGVSDLHAVTSALLYAKILSDVNTDNSTDALNGATSI